MRAWMAHVEALNNRVLMLTLENVIDDCCLVWRSLALCSSVGVLSPRLDPRLGILLGQCEGPSSWDSDAVNLIVSSVWVVERMQGGWRRGEMLRPSEKSALF